MNKRVFAVLTFAATILCAQARRSFTGVITDSVCSTANHANMRMGSNDAECTMACVEDHGASLVLFDGKESYFLSDQKAPEKFAGKQVIVTGTLNAAKKTITVETIHLAERKP